MTFKINKQYKDRLVKWKMRPFSWSQLSSYEYDPHQWYQNYFLDGERRTSAEMDFGKEFAQSIEDGTCDEKYGIDLLSRLQTKKEHPFNVVFNGIRLVGYADAFCDKTFTHLDEVKTGKKAWDQKRVDNHGQLDMYLLMNYITNKVSPDDVSVKLHWVPTQDNGDFSISFVKPTIVHTFETKRTMQDILKFGQRINSVRKQMEEYAKNHA